MAEKYIIMDNNGIIYDGNEDEMTATFEAMASGKNDEHLCGWEGDLVLVKEIKRWR